VGGSLWPGRGRGARGLGGLVAPPEITSKVQRFSHTRVTKTMRLTLRPALGQTPSYPSLGNLSLHASYERFQKHFPTAHPTAPTTLPRICGGRSTLHRCPSPPPPPQRRGGARTWGARRPLPACLMHLPPGPAPTACVRARAALTLLCALAADASSFCSTPDPSLQRAPAPWYSSWHAAYHSVAHSCRHLPRVPQRRSTFCALLWRSRATWQRAATS
jgi:hypothetical protein